MSDTERSFLVTWRREQLGFSPPGAEDIGKMLSQVHHGNWNAVSYTHAASKAMSSQDGHDQFVSDCLKHIPPAFWRGHGREEIVLIYLSAVDDAMELMAENIASRIAKEVT